MKKIRFEDWLRDNKDRDLVKEPTELNGIFKDCSLVQRYGKEPHLRPS